MSNPAARVWNVAPVARNDVNVQMRNRLTCRLANVHADVEAIRCMTPQDLLAGSVDGVGQRLSF